MSVPLVPLSRAFCILLAATALATTATAQETTAQAADSQQTGPQQTASQTAGEAEVADDDFDPGTPLDPLPGMEVDWPEVDGERLSLPELEAELEAERAARQQEREDVGGVESGETGDDESASDAETATADEEAGNEETANVETDAEAAERRRERREQRGVSRLAERDISYDVALVYEGAENLSAAQREEISDRFNSLSKLRELEDDEANIAQISRRAGADRGLLEQLLRIYGYYDAEIFQQIERGEDRDQLTINFEIVAGPQYLYSAINLNGLRDAGPDYDLLRETFGLEVEEPINSDEIVVARLNLDEGLAENGYAFAEVGEPELVIDHAVRHGDLEVPVSPNGKYRFGKIVVDADPLLSARHIQRIARFRPGDVYMRSDIDDLRRALVATGLVSSLTLTPEAVEDPASSDDTGTLDVRVETTPAPLRTIAGELGYGSGEGFRAAVSWEHRNFFPPEGLIRFRGVVGTREQLVSALYRRNNFKRRDQVLTGQLLVSDVNRNAFDARTILASIALERQTNLIFQKKWTWSVGAELLVSDERDGLTIGGRRTFFIGALPLSLNYDGSDDLLNPSTGFRLGGRISPEVSLQSGTFIYARSQIDASYYQSVSDSLVLAARTRIGSIFGADLVEVAPSRRLYAGGGGSVRGYGFQNIGPRDVNNDPVGGRSLVEFSLEARYRFGNFGIVPFLDAGNIYSAQYPDFSGLQYGAGLGFRYYSSFGPLRLDIGTPLNPQPGDSRIGIYISLGQAF